VEQIECDEVNVGFVVPLSMVNAWTYPQKLDLAEKRNTPLLPISYLAPFTLTKKKVL
jgi:hypothetical protein